MSTKSSKSTYGYSELYSDIQPGVETRSYQKRILFEERIGNELPNWKAKILNRENATTSLTAFRDTVVEKIDLSAYGIYGAAGTKSLIRGPWVGNPAAFDISTNGAVYAQLKNKAIADARTYAWRIVNKYQDPFNGARETMGELRETIELFRHPLEQMTKLTTVLARRIEKGKGSRGTNVSKEVGKTWLQYQFGIAPIVRSFTEIRDAILFDRLADFHKKHRTFGQAVSSTTTVVDKVAAASQWYVTRETTIEDKAECFIHFGMLLEKLLKHGDLLQKMDDELLKVETAPALIWELIPLSVFVDMVVNVGDILSASVSNRQAISYSSESVVSTRTYSVKTTNPRGSGTAFGNRSVTLISNGLFSIKRRSVARVGGSLAIPPLVFTLPGSNIQYMNIAALLAASQRAIGYDPAIKGIGHTIRRI